MSSWWRRRSFKVRLTLWYAAATTVALAIFAAITYEVVEHRLAAELDRQLRIDYDLVEAQLEKTPSGEIRWLVRGAHGDEGFARLAAWFEVWSEDGRLLLRHWPVSESSIRSALPQPVASTLRFYGVELEQDLHVRLMERPARVQGTPVVMRLFRDETNMRRTLAEIIEVFLIALPFAVFAASLGGYLVARRSLRPVAAMARQAQRITSESLSERLPNPNPADEFGQLAAVFNSTLQRLEGSFDELKRFTADASHELRTPLTALRAVGEVALRQNASPESLRETISSMLEEAERLHGLIDSLLALARLESGEADLQRQSVAVPKLIREVNESLAVLASEKQQQIEIEAATDLSVTGDRMLLRQALLNIVHNAIRHSPERSRIEIRAHKGSDEVVISIIDQGPGISSEHQARVFDRFYRIHKGRSRAEGGYGLGLSIARRSIERTGGRIELESAPGKGSTFRILLPA
jgi:heavy metal sensor kinase